MAMLFVVGTHVILLFAGLIKVTWKSESMPVQDMILLIVVCLAMIVFYGIFANFR